MDQIVHYPSGLRQQKLQVSNIKLEASRLHLTGYIPYSLHFFLQFTIHHASSIHFSVLSVQEKKEKYFPDLGQICKVNSKDMEKDLFTQKRRFWGHCSRVACKSVEDSCNFLKALDVI